MTVKLANVAPLEVWMLCKGGHLIQSQILEVRTTQRGLAAAVGVSHGYIGQLCSGQKKTCSPETAHKICAALGVPLDAFFWTESSNNSRRNANEKLAARKHQVIPRSVASRTRRGQPAKRRAA